MADPVLAQYTIRSKQEYIFRTNQIKEIVGASYIITKSFDLLFECAKDRGLTTIRAAGKFDFEDTLRQFEAGKLDMAELFIGGGNETVLYKDMDTCRTVNEAFTYRALTEYPGLLPMYVGVPVRKRDGRFDYRKDYAELMAEADREKNRMAPQRGRYALPFAKMDRTTFQPIGGSGKDELSDEAREKRAAFDGLRDSIFNTDEAKLLDRLVTKKGEESLLAIVHADGNNMGKKIQRKLPENERGYDFCVNAMREFTAEIRTVFSEAGRNAMETKLRELEERNEKLPKEEKRRPDVFAVRWLVCDGDDATFICNARLAKELTEAYLSGVSAYCSKDDPSERYSSCAGICIFHSHYPFARAYDLAEQACDSAKGPVHETEKEQGWIDFHFIHGGVGGDLDELRERHRTSGLMARPWFVCGEENIAGNDVRSIEKLDELKRILDKHGVTRSNIKSLGTACEESAEQAGMEWERICDHAKKGLRKETEVLFAGSEKAPGDALRKALYDLAEICDIWYVGKEA